MPEEYNSSTGASYPWENNWNVYDGDLNTNNGNKLTQVPLFSWKQRGGLPVGVTLYHNSEAGNNNELGHNWSWTYDITI
ncbi:MAG TPA: DUF6531 domain-containing protein [Fimbriimonadaceae bacterium]